MSAGSQDSLGEALFVERDLVSGNSEGRITVSPDGMVSLVVKKNDYTLTLGMTPDGADLLASQLARAAVGARAMRKVGK